MSSTTTTFTLSYNPAPDYSVSIRVSSDRLPRMIRWARSLNYSGIRVNGLYPFILGF